MSATAVVFFCHGSRDPGWRAPFERIVDEYRRAHPGRAAHLAFLELMTPGLPEAIDRCVADGHRDLRIVPLFLAPGAHTERDLPALVAAARERWPGLTVRIESTLMESASVRAAVLESLG
ncbi:MAG: sirohydrochlorin chelatase [Lautropia sp.]